MSEFDRLDERRDGTIALLALASIALLAALSFNPGLFNDGDTSWHLAAGQWIIDRHSVPSTDPFSFTFAGKPWFAHEWLAEVAMAGAFEAGGWSALALLAALSVAATLFLIAIEASHYLRPIAALAVVVMVAVVLLPFALARPHVLAWPLLASWVMLLLRARDKKEAPSVMAALPMVLWANLHASYFLGLAFVGFFALEAVIYEKDRSGQLRYWGLFGLAAVAGALVTPHGLRGFLYPLEVSSMQSLPLIGEWRSTDFRESIAFGLFLLACVTVLVVRRNRVPASRILLLALLAFLAVEHVRHQAMLAIIAPLILVRAVGTRTEARAWPAKRVTAALVGLILLAITLRLSIPAERPDSESNPLTAIAHVPADVRDDPVMNSYSFGGPLILSGIRPFIDGRGDMYGDEFMFLHRRIMQGDMTAFEKAVKRWGIRWTILSPLDPLSRKLDSAPGWRRVYADNWAVIHVAR